MFTSNITSIEIELANKCNARCPQCPRHQSNLGGTDLRLEPGLNKDELNYDTFTKNVDVDILKQLVIVDFCGITGDPVIAKDFLPILKHIRKHNSKCLIKVSTNGSINDKQFWVDLAKSIGRGEVLFGLDGLKGTHELYRIGTDYDTIISNAKSFIDAGGNATWQFLVFEHNEHQLEECRNLSESLGFSKFYPMLGERNYYNEETKVYTKEKTYSIRQPKNKKLLNNVVTNSDLNITQDKLPKKMKIMCASMVSNYVFIYADGTVWPCCMLGGMPTWGKNKIHCNIELSMMKKHINFPHDTINLKNFSLSEIIRTPEWHKWEWVTQGHMQTCRLYCGVYN
jgi:MoaA/NifB/PqqE/SkfB family radical SAM enzyme